MPIEVILRDGKEYASDELLLQGIYRTDSDAPMGAVTLYDTADRVQLPFNKRMRIIGKLCKFNPDSYPFRFQNGCGIAELIVAKYGSVQFQ